MSLDYATVAIAANSLPAMRDFYRDVLGLTLTYEDAECACFAEHLVLRQSQLNTPGMVRAESSLALRFYVTDLEGTYRGLKTRGARPIVAPHAYEGYSYAAFADVEGNPIELIELHPPAESANGLRPVVERDLDTLIIGGLLPADVQLGKNLMPGGFESATLQMLARLEARFADLVLNTFPTWGIRRDWRMRTDDGIEIDNHFPFGERPTLTHVALMTACAEAGFRSAPLSIGELLRPVAQTTHLLARAQTLSLSTTYVTNQRVLAILLDRLLPFGVPIILGGPLLGTDESFSSLLGKVAYFVIGDGEFSLPEVLRAINRQPLAGTARFEERDGSTIVTMDTATEPARIGMDPPPEAQAARRTSPSAKRADPSTIERYPTPDWRLVTFPERSIPIIEYESVRGCPYRCEFCNYPFLFGEAGFRVKSARRIFEDWKYYVEVVGIRNICSLDSLFTIPPKRLRELCSLLTGSNLRVRWNCFARVDDLANDELAHAMAEAGCRNVSVGFESGNQQVLDNMNKKVRLEQSYKAVENCRRFGILVSGLFVVGFPGETERTAQDTVRFIIETSPDGYALYTMSYFSPTARMPILEPAQREKYGLSLAEHDVYVQNPSWTHQTMNSATALALTEQMIHEIGQSGCTGVFLDRFNPALLQLVYSDLSYDTCRAALQVLRLAERAMYTAESDARSRLVQHIAPYLMGRRPVNRFAADVSPAEHALHG